MLYYVIILAIYKNMKKVYSYSCYSGYPTEYNDQHNESIKPLHVHITDTGRKRRKHYMYIEYNFIATTKSM